MSLIAVRAESAPYRLVSRPEAQRAEFAAIADASRDALHDMRCLVGTLRAGDAPPGIGGLRALAAGATSAGLAVAVDVDPAVERAAVPGLAVYRVVQEALSNAARHAPGGTVRVSVRLAGDRVRVCVDNTAATRPASGCGPAGGNGLTGMRERVTALGGTLSAGPAGDGGFRVEAVVPLTPLAFQHGKT
jgi:signal transduction histidine kinase